MSNAKFGGAVPILKYFNIRGRAEPIRVLFEDQGVKYEDKRVAKEEWVELKKNLVESGDNIFGQLPVLVINGKTYVQSYAIFRYIGNHLDIYGSNLEERYQIDMFAEGLTDLVREMVVLFGNNDEAKQLFWKDKFPLHAGNLDKVLANNGGPFVLGTKFSWIDAVAFNLVSRVLPDVADVKEKYPHFGKLHAAVAARPNIAAYLASDRVPK